jgi:hypothetical protein
MQDRLGLDPWSFAFVCSRSTPMQKRIHSVIQTKPAPDPVHPLLITLALNVYTRVMQQDVWLLSYGSTHASFGSMDAKLWIERFKARSTETVKLIEGLRSMDQHRDGAHQRNRQELREV